VAAQWARSVFPFNDSFARMICISVMDDARGDVKDEGKKGLHV